MRGLGLEKDGIFGYLRTYPHSLITKIERLGLRKIGGASAHPTREHEPRSVAPPVKLATPCGNLGIEMPKPEDDVDGL
jgi:hypothetical protein